MLWVSVMQANNDCIACGQFPDCAAILFAPDKGAVS
jgi:hypothetical protein